MVMVTHHPEKLANKRLMDVGDAVTLHLFDISSPICFEFFTIFKQNHKIRETEFPRESLVLVVCQTTRDFLLFYPKVKATAGKGKEKGTRETLGIPLLLQLFSIDFVLKSIPQLMLV